MNEMNIPFNRPYLTGNETKNILEAAEHGQLAGDGDFTDRCHELLRKATGSSCALLTHSCTGALEMAALLANLSQGDEVIMPSYTFVSTANAFCLRGATPVFVDIREDTLNLDEKLVPEAITENTKAIVGVHYAGVACEPYKLREIAHAHGLLFIEDAAQALGARYDGRPLGSFGDMGALSFHETKNVISGEGGALLLNDESLISRAEILRDKGTNRKSFLRGERAKYTWVDLGSSYLPGEMVAAFLFAQLKHLSAITQKKIEIWNRYHEALYPLEQEGILRRPIIPPGCEHNGHLYYILLNDAKTRDVTLSVLNRRGIQAVFHYVPLHSSPAGLRYGRTFDSLTVTETTSQRLIRLPSWIGLDSVEIIVRELKECLTNLR